MNKSFKSKLSDYFKQNEYSGRELLSKMGLKDILKLNSKYSRF